MSVRDIYAQMLADEGRRGGKERREEAKPNTSSSPLSSVPDMSSEGAARKTLVEEKRRESEGIDGSDGVDTTLLPSLPSSSLPSPPSSSSTRTTAQHMDHSLWGSTASSSLPTRKGNEEKPADAFDLYDALCGGKSQSGVKKSNKRERKDDIKEQLMNIPGYGLLTQGSKTTSDMSEKAATASTEEAKSSSLPPLHTFASAEEIFTYLKRYLAILSDEKGCPPEDRKRALGVVSSLLFGADLTFAFLSLPPHFSNNTDTLPRGAFFVVFPGAEAPMQITRDPEGHDGMVLVPLFPYIQKIIARRICDTCEAVRIAAIQLCSAYLVSGNLVRHLPAALPYLMPSVFSLTASSYVFDEEKQMFAKDEDAHLAHMRGRVVESQQGMLASNKDDLYRPTLHEKAEAVQLVVVDFFRALIGRMHMDGSTSLLDSYWHDIVMSLHALGSGLAPEVKVQASLAIEEACKAAPQVLKHYAVGISRSLMTIGLAHKLARVRTSTISLLEALVCVPDPAKWKGAGTEAFLSLLAARDPNIVPVSSFYTYDTSVNYFAKLAVDPNQTVRHRFARALSRWMLELPDKHDWWGRLLPYLLSSLSDEGDVDPVRIEPTSNEQFLIDSKNYTIPEVCLGTLYLLGDQHEKEHMDKLLDKLQAGFDGDTEVSYSRPLPAPFKKRPRLGTRLFVRAHAPRFIKAILNEVAEYLPFGTGSASSPATGVNTRFRAAQLLCHLLTFLEETVTQDVHLLAPALVGMIHDKALSESKHGQVLDYASLAPQAACAACLMGRFVEPNSYMPVLMDIAKGKAQVQTLTVYKSSPVVGLLSPVEACSAACHVCWLAFSEASGGRRSQFLRSVWSAEGLLSEPIVEQVLHAASRCHEDGQPTGARPDSLLDELKVEDYLELRSTAVRAAPHKHAAGSSLAAPTATVNAPESMHSIVVKNWLLALQSCAAELDQGPIFNLGIEGDRAMLANLVSLLLQLRDSFARAAQDSEAEASTLGGLNPDWVNTLPMDAASLSMVPLLKLSYLKAIDRCLLLVAGQTMGIRAAIASCTLHGIGYPVPELALPLLISLYDDLLISALDKFPEPALWHERCPPQALLNQLLHPTHIAGYVMSETDPPSALGRLLEFVRDILKTIVPPDPVTMPVKYVDCTSTAPELASELERAAGHSLQLGFASVQPDNTLESAKSPTKLFQSWLYMCFLPTFRVVLELEEKFEGFVLIAEQCMEIVQVLAEGFRVGPAVGTEADLGGLLAQEKGLSLVWNILAVVGVVCEHIKRPVPEQMLRLLASYCCTVFFHFSNSSASSEAPKAVVVVFPDLVKRSPPTQLEIPVQRLTHYLSEPRPSSTGDESNLRCIIVRCCLWHCMESARVDLQYHLSLLDMINAWLTMHIQAEDGEQMAVLGTYASLRRANLVERASNAADSEVLCASSADEFLHRSFSFASLAPAAVLAAVPTFVDCHPGDIAAINDHCRLLLHLKS